MTLKITVSPNKLTIKFPGPIGPTGATGPGGTDSDAIHDNVASEISVITAKATPTGSDFLVIEDAAAANAKKSITIADIDLAASQITSGTLVHERGGLEADISAYSGLIKIAAGVTSNAVSGTDYAAVSHNHNASDVNAGTLAHERGGIEADISAVAIGDIPTGSGAGTMALVTSTGHSDGDVFTRQADGSADWEAPAGGTDYICVVDEKAANTDGGTFTLGAWRTRDINTEYADAGGHASIATNQITLAAGTYRCYISAPAYLTSQHKAKLYNITDAADEIIGTSEHANAATQSRSVIAGSFTIASSKAFEVQHYCAVTVATNGFGVKSNFSVVEVYTIAQFWKEA